MGKANSEVTVGFTIMNDNCRYYIGECSRDEKPHTCCKEECGLSEVMFEIYNERKVQTHHEMI